MRNAVEPIIRRAAELMLNFADPAVYSKGRHADFVTEADVAVQDFLLNSLSKAFPEARFLAEEGEGQQLTDALHGADAVVFAAGAGPGSGPERKRTVDYGAAVKLIAAAEAAGVDRYVMVSSIGAHQPEAGQGPMRAYLQAKADADEALAASGLQWTIVRPGSLTDDPGTGLVSLSTDLGRRGPIPRDDVAAVVERVIAGRSRRPDGPRAPLNS